MVGAYLPTLECQCFRLPVQCQRVLWVPKPNRSAVGMFWYAFLKCVDCFLLYGADATEVPGISISEKKKSDALIYWEGWAPFPLLHHSLNIRTVACNRLGLYWLLVYLYIARALTFSKPLTLHQVYLYINYVWSVQATLHIRYILSKSFYLNRQHCR